jgi:thymidylate synthase ThyX
MSDTNPAIADPKPAATSNQAAANAAASETDVYAIHGADPEVLAYAMAKYSRSSLSMKESLSEISSQRAEQFLNTFYFQYGHRSIADLAHIPFAIERLSLLAAIALVDEQRWDGQERSTRYQNFRKSGWFTPQLPPDRTTAYTASVEALLSAYDKVSAGMLEALKRAIPQPAEMDDGAYTRTLKARAFDVARYLLPLATNTSLGQIVSARTLENQIARLLSSEFSEVRALGERLKSAAASPAWNVNHDAARVLLAEAASFSIPDAAGREDFHARLADALIREVKTAPTLVKYASANEYAIASRAELSSAAAELMSGQPIEPAPVVDLVDDLGGAAGSLEVELATSLLYPQCHYSWRQLQHTVAALPAARIAELIALGTKHRGRHDELPRTFSAGQGLKFDILMDIGGFRDMHRHRRCVQLLQPFTSLHGYEEPVCPGQPTLAEAGLADTYASAMDAAHAAHRTLRDSTSNASSAAHTARSSNETVILSEARSPATKEGVILSEARSAESKDLRLPSESAAYLLPLGTRVRAMFKMDFAEAHYIAELRSGVAGHFSYRRVAWEMYRAVAQRHPALAPCFRIEDVNQPVDLLKR